MQPTAGMFIDNVQNIQHIFFLWPPFVSKQSMNRVRWVRADLYAFSISYINACIMQPTAGVFIDNVQNIQHIFFSLATLSFASKQSMDHVRWVRADLYAFSISYINACIMQPTAGVFIDNVQNIQHIFFSLATLSFASKQSMDHVRWVRADLYAFSISYINACIMQPAAGVFIDNILTFFNYCITRTGIIESCAF